MIAMTWILPKKHGSNYKFYPCTQSHTKIMSSLIYSVNNLSPVLWIHHMRIKHIYKQSQRNARIKRQNANWSSFCTIRLIREYLRHAYIQGHVNKPVLLCDYLLGVGLRNRWVVFSDVCTGWNPHTHSHIYVILWRNYLSKELSMNVICTLFAVNYDFDCEKRKDSFE